MYFPVPGDLAIDRRLPPVVHTQIRSLTWISSYPPARNDPNPHKLGTKHIKINKGYIYIIKRTWKNISYDFHPCHHRELGEKNPTIWKNKMKNRNSDPCPRGCEIYMGNSGVAVRYTNHWRTRYILEWYNIKDRFLMS